MGQRLYVNPYPNSVSTNTTWASLLGLEADFDLVQLIYENYVSTPYTVGGAIIAPSAAANDGYYPVDGSGAAQAWTQVTFNNGGADSPPAVTPGGVTTVTVPGVISGSPPNAIESRVFSDWMPVSSLPRTDGGSLPLLMTRSYMATAFTAVVATPTAKLLTEWPTINSGRTIQCYYKSGNFVSNPAGFTTPNGPNQYLSIIGVRFYSRAKGIILLVGGDSLTQGLNSTSNHNGFGLQTAKLMSSAARPVSLVNVGYASQTSAAFYQNLMKAIDGFKPTVVTIPVLSPNDTQDQTNADTAWASAQSVYAYAVSKGALPVLWTAFGDTALSGGTEAIRVAQNQRVRNSGLRYVDFDAVISDGASPARIKSAYNSGDGRHLNDAGYGAEAAALKTLLDTLPLAA